MARKFRVEYPGAIWATVGGPPSQLAQHPKSVPDRIAVEGRLRTGTTMSWGWIASRLAMGTAGYAAHCLRRTTKPNYTIWGHLYGMDPFDNWELTSAQRH
jgi:hypothetical protein